VHKGLSVPCQRVRQEYQHMHESYAGYSFDNLYSIGRSGALLADSSSKCNEWSFEEYLIRRFVRERFSRAIVKPFNHCPDPFVIDL
jgi:hypothetical protein